MEQDSPVISIKSLSGLLWGWGEGRARVGLPVVGTAKLTLPAHPRGSDNTFWVNDQGMGGSGNSVDVDLAIALDHLTLAAVEHGLGTCWIGAFSEREVKRLLNVPPQVKVVAITPLGYPANTKAFHPAEGKRKSLDEIICYETYTG